jgi:hypothetical protein
MFSLPAVAVAQSSTQQASSLSTARPQSVTLGCDYKFVSSVEGIYPGKGGAFVEWDVPPFLMQLTFCKPGSGVTSVALPPSNAPQYGYTSMAGVQTTTLGTVLVLDSNNPPGFWICEGAQSSGCAIETNYITLPSGFCSSQPFGNCDPMGIAMDKHMNVYYADPSNADVVKCTYLSGYQTCSTVETLTGNPAGIYRASNGDLWVTDSSCAGNVWKNGAVVATMNDEVEGITISKANLDKAPHLYFAVTGRCFYGSAFIFDYTDRQIITPYGSPFSAPGDIPGITTKLWFTTGTLAKMYIAKDKV